LFSRDLFILVFFFNGRLLCFLFSFFFFIEGFVRSRFYFYFYFIFGKEQEPWWILWWGQLMSDKVEFAIGY